MAGEEDLYGTVLSHLPRGIQIQSIRAHARLRSAPGKSWGETYLLLHEGNLIMMTRESVFDPYDVVHLDPETPPLLKAGTHQSDVFVRTSTGLSHRLPVSPDELGKVQAVLDAYAELLQAPKDPADPKG